MKRHAAWMLCWMMAITWWASPVLAQPGGGGASAPSKWDVSFSAMALQNSTQQGGQGTSGSTTLTQTEFNWHKGWYGLGAFFQYDKQGKYEVDTAAGPKLEVVFDPFFLEFGYGYYLNRAFTDRSIANQKGKMQLIGVGSRFKIGGGGQGGGGGGGAGGGAFFMFQYKFRTQTITTQDGLPLSEPIIQKDVYPLLGFGYSI